MAHKASRHVCKSVVRCTRLGNKYATNTAINRAHKNYGNFSMASLTLRDGQLFIIHFMCAVRGVCASACVGFWVGARAHRNAESQAARVNGPHYNAKTISLPCVCVCARALWSGELMLGFTGQPRPAMQMALLLCIAHA